MFKNSVMQIFWSLDNYLYISYLRSSRLLWKGGGGEGETGEAEGGREREEITDRGPRYTKPGPQAEKKPTAP